MKLLITENTRLELIELYRHNPTFRRIVDISQASDLDYLEMLEKAVIALAFHNEQLQKKWVDEELQSMWPKTMLLPINEEQFREQYLCTFEPDPEVEKCLEYLKLNNPSDIKFAKQNNMFSSDVFKQAEKIINREP